ncbi:hypothetical protein EYC84_004764 [Monilinia fructicola]|uniref:Uncharacterized protein n=1 Tax=Monilinia fructicola TaxID=38448 RepID=A0A5M9K3Y4_MONFR|nr:hypothetical protein EYC84_004764 [Monilinia fructicola]
MFFWYGFAILFSIRVRAGVFQSLFAVFSVSYLQSGTHGSMIALGSRAEHFRFCLLGRSDGTMNGMVGMVHLVSLFGSGFV